MLTVKLARTLDLVASRIIDFEPNFIVFNASFSIYNAKIIIFNAKFTSAAVSCRCVCIVVPISSVNQSK